jgi:uncharacterized protein
LPAAPDDDSVIQGEPLLPGTMPLILAAALAGLMATPHCAGMCGGFASACAGPGAGRAGAGVWCWHAGRLTTYAALGAVAGLAGSALPGPAWLPAALSAVLLVWFAAALAGIVAQPSTRVPGLARAGAFLAGRPGIGARYVFGLATGLLPCGMVYAALGLAVAAANPVHSATAMIAFGAATAPGLTVLSAGVRRVAVRGPWSRRGIAAAILLVGLWSVAQRGLAPGRHTHGAGAETDVHADPVPTQQHH